MDHKIYEDIDDAAVFILKVKYYLIDFVENGLYEEKEWWRRALH